MEFHLDREIRLSEESPYKNLYSWSLQEFSKDGKKIGSDQIPWPWTLYFTASELRYAQSIRIERSGEANADVESSETEQSDSITAIVHPGICTDGQELERDTTYSMFGTDRGVESFSLRIFRLADGEVHERCSVWGCVSYTSEIDFRDETENDTVEIHAWLAPKRFDLLLEMLRSQSIATTQLSLGGVSGFYAAWSPAVSTDSIKMLASGEEQNVVVPEGCQIEPPRLGAVAKFDLTLVHRTELNPKQDFRPVHIRKFFREEDREESAQDQEHLRETSVPNPNATFLDHVVRAECTLKRLSLQLWLIAILLVILLLR